MLIKDYKPADLKMIQILDEEGNLNEELRPKELTDEVVKELYEKMVYCRMVDDKAIKMQRTGRMGTYVSIEGVEACQIGSEFAIDKTDWLVPAFRELPAMWAHGMPMENLLVYWIGNEAGSVAPEGVNVLPVSIPVGSQMTHAVGLAGAAKLKGEKQISLTYFGDGATSEGDFHEALNFAAVFRAGTIFICQNNQFSISTSKSSQTVSETFAEKAHAYGVPGALVDGMDLFAMYAVTKEAAARAREGKGPTLIEAFMYRYSDHTTSDNASIYRDDKEVEKWRPKDPLIRIQKYLGSKGLWDDAYEKDLRERLKKEIEEVIKKAQAIPEQTVDQLFDHTYAELTQELQEQKEQMKHIKQQRSGK
ncbi:pyruvate dehydrogenase (acetyl-transferring) E1 component subunit alpha [Pseudomonadota bacterium]